MNLKTTIFASALLFSSLFAKIQHLCISHHRLCEPHQLQVLGFRIKFCVNSAHFPQNNFQSPEWLRLVWEVQRRQGINVRNVLNRKKAWLKYYEWEYMVVWNLSLCVRFEHMPAKFWGKKYNRKSYFWVKHQGLHILLPQWSKYSFFQPQFCKRQK